MIRYSLMAMALVWLVGCQASTSIQPVSTNSKSEETAQLAAYAATARLPDIGNPREDLRVGAVVNRDSGNIRLYNFTDKPIAAGNVWVNRSYVQRFDTIPARGYTTLSRDRFFDRNGQSLSNLNAPVDNVWLQWDNDVYSLEGPVYQ